MNADLPLPVMAQQISQEIKQQSPGFRDRVIRWAVSAAVVNGVPEESVLRILQDKTPDRHWWHVRQMLPEAAIKTLYIKVTSELEEVEDF